MKIEHVAKKDFKYGGEIIKKGQTFAPLGGRWDKKIMNPENGMVFVREVEEPAAVYSCDKCGREFSKPQGLSAHKRHCKGGSQ